MRFTASLLAMLLLSAATRADEPAPKSVAFRHATVIDPDRDALLRDQTVIMQGERIAAVDADGKARVPADALVIDATGKYLIPGLWDMHVHSSDKNSLPLFVANGVTGVRIMWGNPAFGFPAGKFHFQWRKEIAEGALLGPRLVVASNILDGPKPIWPSSKAIATPDEGRKAVRDAKAEGADFIKVYSKLPHDAYMAIADESKSLGIPFAGHVPRSVGVMEASKAGQRSIEHLTGVLLACSAKEVEIRKELDSLLAASGGGSSGVAIPSIERKMRETYDDATARALFATFKTNETWQCPTLTVLRALGSLDDEQFTNDPRLKYVAPYMRTFWNPKADARFKSWTAEDYANARLSFRKSKELVGAMQQAGVPILAGTDEMNPYCFPGFSLHDELALLVDAGLSPREALRAATINPARFLGREKDLGNVQVGKLADLVLLDANPWDDIKNTAKIRAVVANGRLLDRAALDKLLTDAEKGASPKAAAQTLPRGLLGAGRAD
jgi:imidazolonepropionase-like amidohydrolase